MVDLVRIDRNYLEDARSLLGKAMEMEFESVILFGFKQGRIYVQSSAHPDILKLIGALEAAKLELWCGGG